VSAFAVASGFGDEGLVNLESIWGRVNDIGTTWLNAKVGRVELDLPVSEHRGLTLTTPFLIYHYHPAGSVDGFSFGDNQLGVEVSGHGEGPGLRYALTLAGGSGNPGASGLLGSPALYTHVTYTLLPRSRILGRLRLGLLGDVGWWPTTFATLTTDDAVDPVPGTGKDQRPFLHAGGEVHATFGPLAAPLEVTLVWLYGQESRSLVPGATRSARFHGGFAEVDYTPWLPFTVFGRYDLVRNLRQGDPSVTDDTGDQDGLTLGVRYALWLSAWGSLAAHAEVSTVETSSAAASGTAVRVTTTLAGFDFAI
jgi:hypothetical protein